VVGDGPLRDAVKRTAESLDHSVSLFFRASEEEKRESPLSRSPSSPDLRWPSRRSC